MRAIFQAKATLIDERKSAPKRARNGVSRAADKKTGNSARLRGNTPQRVFCGVGKFVCPRSFSDMPVSVDGGGEGGKLSINSCTFSIPASKAAFLSLLIRYRIYGRSTAFSAGVSLVPPAGLSRCRFSDANAHALFSPSDERAAHATSGVNERSPADAGLRLRSRVRVTNRSCRRECSPAVRRASRASSPPKRSSSEVRT